MSLQDKVLHHTLSQNEIASRSEFEASRDSDGNPINNNNSRYTEITDIDDEDGNNLNFSLAHYFSTTFIVFMVLLITATITLFIWSNLSDGAWVSLQAHPVFNTNSTNTNNDDWFPFAVSFMSNNNNNLQYDPSKTLSSINLDEIPDIKDLSINLDVFSFSLVSSVSDFWQSKAYGLALLIAAFSGVWPYIKLLLLMVCWLQPMKQENREAIIIFLDQMGKFSFIDLFVSLYMIVSFYVNITKSFHGVGVNLKVVVEPDVGLNTFVIGTSISMIFSHIFLYLDAKYAKPHIKQLRLMQQNRKSMNDNNDDKEIKNNKINVDDDDDNDAEQIEKKIINLNQHNWNISNKPLFIRYLPSTKFGIILRSIMLLMVIITSYTTIDTIFTAPVRYNITGLVGWAISDPVRSYTSWQIVREVPTHTDEHIAAPPLSAALFMTIVLCPILLVTVMIIIWYAPIKYKLIHNLNITMQFCMAWCAVDVFAVASIAASLELDRVSQWILNDNYASICGSNGIIPKIFFGAQCFAVEGHLVWGTWLVVYTAISLWIIFVYTIYEISRAKKYFHDLLHRNDADKTIFFFDH